MRCEETHDLLSAYLDQELDVVRHTDMAQHLDTCPPVRTRVHRTASGAVGAPDGLALYTLPVHLESGAVGGAPGP